MKLLANRYEMPSTVSKSGKGPSIVRESGRRTCLKGSNRHLRTGQLLANQGEMVFMPARGDIIYPQFELDHEFLTVDSDGPATR